ncbi:peptidase inhibitor family I36 protein [Streptomyces galbus]|uniref:peptidase inhibitor family I36 protein n=1 Tax=Streptomyces galbus TaxID=33898 RepID=UPI0037FD067F
MRHGRARTLAAAAALAATVGVGIINAPTASANSADCPANEFCMWQHSNYDGILAYSSEPQPDLHDFNDRATSFWNRTSSWISVYRDNNYGYCLANISPGSSSPNVGNALNDRISSFRPGQCTVHGGNEFSTF